MKISSKRVLDKKGKRILILDEVIYDSNILSYVSFFFFSVKCTIILLIILIKIFL